MISKIIRCAFMDFVVGVSLCACHVAQTIEPTHILPTPSASTWIDTPSQPVQLTVPIPTITQTPGEKITANMETQTTPTMKTVVDQLRITLVYDNNTFDLRLKTAWGFSALVEYHGYTLLFDTGGDGNILLDNMHVLGIDPANIQSIILSHIHGDHTAGLSVLLDYGYTPPVYLLPSFTDTYKHQVGLVTHVIEVTSEQFIADGILTTGEIPGNIPEQALVIRTGVGLVVITGCAHPGIVKIIERAKELTGDPVYLVLGGFHLGSKSEGEIFTILADFRRLGVQNVAPCHCTGALAIAMFATEYGKSFVQVGAGAVITIDGRGIVPER
jgi:7,8-dihydropterin-6-yl-methyl-4-(beta-D-ribofuranosyl)aminobenzene 5'-phosphate synthase